LFQFLCDEGVDYEYRAVTRTDLG